MKVSFDAQAGPHQLPLKCSFRASLKPLFPAHHRSKIRSICINFKGTKLKAFKRVQGRHHLLYHKSYFLVSREQRLSSQQTNLLYHLLWYRRHHLLYHKSYFLVSREQRLSSQQTNLTTSPLINRGFLANIYFLSKFRMHLQSVANITEKKRSPNNSNVTDKKHHCSLTWKPKMEASTIAITINKTVTAPTVNQSSKSRRIQHSPEKALINSESKN